MPFDRYNLPPTRPVIVSIPHAGRLYPADHSALRLPLGRLAALEDRHADLLAATAIAEGCPAIVARMPRLWIDLNRPEGDLDPGMTGTGRIGAPLSSKVRGGLGLIPRRVGSSGEIWRLPLVHDDVRRRIESVHRPYHAEIAAALTGARSRFGAALLLDLHSMPPIAQPDAPDIVIGDRFGASASPWLTEAAAAFLAGRGMSVAVNAPYPGGHIIAHHANPAANIHALQIEFDRRLYLDAKLESAGPGLRHMQTLLTGLVGALTDELLAGSAAIAAQ